MEENQIRNFVIISHIDHGKSTLADRFLELTDTISKEKMHPQYLDSMDLEREKGITIKMKPVTMIYRPLQSQKSSSKFILNLIDTPGHVDFSYEVSRSLAAVEGAILLVDAVKGIQAQTLANLELAQKEKLVLIPVINKIDLPQAKTEETKKELANLLNIKEDEIFSISAKTGENVKKLLDSLILKIPGPEIRLEKPFRALIFDSKYDSFLGVVAYVRVVDGKIRKGEEISFLASQDRGIVKEVGIFKPDLTPIEELKSGQIGFITTGIKEPEKIRIGDTITKILDYRIEPLAGYREPEPKVFVSLYPENQTDFELLKNAFLRLKLNDSSLFFQPQKYQLLGRGFLCGFLGSLHAEITIERLKREFNLNLIVGAPQVCYKVLNQQGKETSVFNAADWPENPQKVFEPWVELKVITPLFFLSKVFELLKSFGGKYLDSSGFSKDRFFLVYQLPLRSLIGNFYQKLLNVSQGFASLTYREIGFEEGDLVKLEILIAGKTEELLSRIVPKTQVFLEARKMVKKLKELLPSQLFAVSIQAKISGKIIARETKKARRRDVIAPLYGGDYTRKRKLLEKQKKGKEKLKERGQLKIPSRVFFKMFTSD